MDLCWISQSLDPRTCLSDNSSEYSILGVGCQVLPHCVYGDLRHPEVGFCFGISTQSSPWHSVLLQYHCELRSPHELKRNQPSHHQYFCCLGVLQHPSSAVRVCRQALPVEMRLNYRSHSAAGCEATYDSGRWSKVGRKDDYGSPTPPPPNCLSCVIYRSLGCPRTFSQGQGMVGSKTETRALLYRWVYLRRTHQQIKRPCPQYPLYPSPRTHSSTRTMAHARAPLSQHFLRPPRKCYFLYLSAGSLATTTDTAFAWPCISRGTFSRR